MPPHVHQDLSKHQPEREAWAGPLLTYCNQHPQGVYGKASAGSVSCILLQEYVITAFDVGVVYHFVFHYVEGRPCSLFLLPRLLSETGLVFSLRAWR